mmetsp:Transcript_43932/g.125745  ORF Transcript_43932/g.125745 Transcript_43932/m.125745 type:complete len:230 (+) Transcript_43932:92-781(+)|eukprot:CAMPEP_0177228820 /NCGR_PEP_ID=MMETSP0367-20130122/41362_1 /TAXON_ID=447022 ORGANISM="Scrippsiella hangoei-like, Strain SHHI-4" /NCGR_SAMPLE_ID=MMETSP0367 /ASSEMBLY_ACC=CAM_ASM_000362 /LENGTH=229 /DNA_ID=CAMNT_0018679163 /DNA_START=66 /DNA_END=755 /DNA_ORIENTATION=-
MAARTQEVTRHRHGLGAGVALLGGLGLVGAVALACRSSAAFLPGAAVAATGRTAVRRELLLGGLAAGFALRGGIEPAEAKEPEGVIVSGNGPRKEVFGKWTLVLGTKRNGKAVYKRDGADSLYLVYNDCDQFQMSMSKDGTCDGFGKNVKGVWEFDGQPAPDVKVKPITPKDLTPMKPQFTAKELLDAEDAAIKREREMETFRGTMEEVDELSGDRLLNKMGAVIAKGY